MSETAGTPFLAAGAGRLKRAGAPAARTRLGRDAVRAATDLLRISDVLAVVAAGGVADLGYRWLQNWRFESDYLKIVLAAGVLTPFVFAHHDAYAQGQRRPGRGLAACGLKAGVSLYVALVLLGFLMKLDFSVSRLWFGAWAALGLAGVTAPRLAILALAQRLERRGVLRESVAVVGSTSLARFVIAHLQAVDRSVEVVGVFEDRRAEGRADGPEPDGSIDDLLRLGQTRPIDRVILALPWSAQARIEALLTRLMALSVDVSVCPDETALSILRRPVDDLEGLPTFHVARRPLRLWRLVAKRAEDVVLGGLLVALLAPVMATVALLVRLDSPGPVLFRQRRHGYNNREITVFKFRTMRVEGHDPSGARQTARDDERVTRVGRLLRRLSLDELPQLLNVLKGDMSLVGPRPHPVGMRTENLLGQEIIGTYAHRHRVKPGLTGWAQVHGCRGATHDRQALERRVEYDLDYIERCSLWLDLRILAMTPLSLLATRNAF